MSCRSMGIKHSFFEKGYEVYTEMNISDEKFSKEFHHLEGLVKSGKIISFGMAPVADTKVGMKKGNYYFYVKKP